MLADRLRAGTPLVAVGRAERVRLDGDEVAWVLPERDGALAERLLRASRKGLFGFASAERLDDGRHALVRCGGELLSGAGKAPVPWRDAIGKVRALVRAQVEHEDSGWAAAPLGSREVALAPSALLAGGALALAVGGVADGSSVSPRWASPEVLLGGSWDHAASRYFLALVAYRLLAGELPAAAAGLRAAVESRARSAPPPFADAVARQLAPGVQSAVLGWLGPALDRPSSASEMLQQCDQLLGHSQRAATPAAAAPPARKGAAKVVAVVPSFARAWAWPLVAGGLGVAVSLAVRPSEEVRARPAIRAARMTGTSPADCAPCHEREVNEWQRSVMSQATKSPLFGALESAVEEQVGRDARCPNGAGALRAVPSDGDVCTDERSSIATTGSGGEGWCVNCHAMNSNVTGTRPTWSAVGDARSRAPLRDVLPESAQQGISCVGCHTTIGPVQAHARARGYEGNATWTSAATGRTFTSRPEDDEGVFGISNSGYRLDPALLSGRAPSASNLAPHASPSETTRDYLRSSEMCGTCHDVRLFGTDVLGGERGEHMKRLRNAYSEWRAWSDARKAQGRAAATCQGCHMSRYPGVCVPAKAGDAADPDCPSGTTFSARPPSDAAEQRTHYFTSVDLPLAPSYPEAFLSERSLDAGGTPIGLRARRNLLLKRTFDFRLGEVRDSGGRLEIPVRLENVGAGHRVPAGFSQEREIWVELTVTDAAGAVVYEVGRVDRADEDLRDKSFRAIDVSGAGEDARGRPLGVFGATVTDGPDAPRWSPPPALGGADFRGLGLVNLQNGFLRCVRCIGTIDASGECVANDDQRGARADRFVDGAYDLDTGACESNLTGTRALFETYFPVGSLDASRGVAKAPDAIIDTRSAPPDVPLTYTYELDTGRHAGPFNVRARLRFRAFPPYLVRAFADYEALQASRGLRPTGPQVSEAMLSRVEIVDLATAQARVP